jgi:tRNA (cmo5U34)-methyltransferase
MSSVQENKIDQTTPGDKWAFDTDVTQVFDDMLARSIPQYDVMRQACFDLACRYVKPKTDILDLGCSRGEAMARLLDEFGALNRFVGIDVSEPMLAAARERFQGFINCGVVQVLNTDLRNTYPPCRASVTLAVLTIQFTPIEYRQRIMREIFHHTLPGGAFLFVEKVMGSTAELDAAFIDKYYGLKAAHGYSQEQIERKRLSLEGVLVPVTARWNEDLLLAAGFRQIDCFWRWMNFAGWVAVKEETR